MNNIAGKIGNMMIGWIARGAQKQWGELDASTLRLQSRRYRTCCDIQEGNLATTVTRLKEFACSSSLRWNPRCSQMRPLWQGIFEEEDITEAHPEWSCRSVSVSVSPLKKKGTFKGAPLRQKRKSDVYAVTVPGRGTGEGEASPSPPRRENFEILLPWNGVSLHLRINSIAFCLHTIHYNKPLFSIQ